jgi:hypothetical protein
MGRYSEIIRQIAVDTFASIFWPIARHAYCVTGQKGFAGAHAVARTLRSLYGTWRRGRHRVVQHARRRPPAWAKPDGVLRD